VLETRSLKHRNPRRIKLRHRLRFVRVVQIRTRTTAQAFIFAVFFYFVVVFVVFVDFVVCVRFCVVVLVGVVVGFLVVIVLCGFECWFCSSVHEWFV